MVNSFFLKSNFIISYFCYKFNKKYPDKLQKCALVEIVIDLTETRQQKAPLPLKIESRGVEQADSVFNKLSVFQTRNQSNQFRYVFYASSFSHATRDTRYSSVIKAGGASQKPGITWRSLYFSNQASARRTHSSSEVSAGMPLNC